MTDATRGAETPAYAAAVAALEQMARSAAVPDLPGRDAGLAHARLQQAELRYRTLVEHIPVVTFLAALDGSAHELYVSPQIESLLGFTQAEWLGNPFLWYNQLHPDDRERWQAEFARTCATGVDFRSEYRFLTRDGRVVWVHGECQVARDAHGRPLFLVRQRTAELADANARLREEVAERRRLEDAVRQRAEQLAEENRRKDHFLAVLAHELRNPLAPLSNAVHLLGQDGAGRDVAAWARAVADRQVRYMSRLIDDLLDIARINQDKIRLRTEPLDLAEIVVRAADSTRPSIVQQRHELKLALPPYRLALIGDPVRLEQVVVNLLTNAAKYTDPGGLIEVTAERDSDAAVIRVRDTGVGIPPDMLERIFEIFTQVDNSMERRSQWGLGIGLALARRLVELHGGSIRAFSPGPGKGSEFVVRLPMGPPKDSAAPGTGSEPAQKLHQ